MATGIGARFMEFRNMVMELAGLASDVGTVTTTSEAGALNNFFGIVTTNALNAAAAGTETIVITNTNAKAGDFVLYSMLSESSAGLPRVIGAVVTDNTITFTVVNDHASAALDGAVVIGYMLIKALSGITPNSA